jgi:hypothetical protein
MGMDECLLPLFSSPFSCSSSPRQICFFKGLLSGCEERASKGEVVVVFAVEGEEVETTKEADEEEKE